MSSTQSPAPDWQIWACKQLGVTVEASEPEVRSALFRKLQEAEFTPQQSLRFALQLQRLLTQPGEPPKRALEACRNDRLRALRDSIDEFARCYWSLPPAHRQRTHADLLSQAFDAPLLQLRLDGLRDGLTLEAIVPGENPIHCMAAKFQELYVLPPLDRAVRREEFAESLRSQKEASKTLRLFTKMHPAIAGLEPRLNVGILAPPKRTKLRRLRRYNDPVAPAQGKSGSGKKLGWQIYVILMAVSGVLRMGVWSANSQKEPDPKPGIPLIKAADDLELRITKTPGGKTTLETFDRLSGINLNDLHLETKTSLDGIKTTEVVDKSGKTVRASEGAKRFLSTKRVVPEGPGKDVK